MDPNEYDGYDAADEGQNAVLDQTEAESEAGQKRNTNNDKAVNVVYKLAYLTIFLAFFLPLQFEAVELNTRWRVVGTDRHQLADGSLPVLNAGETIALEATSSSWNSFICSYEWKFDHSSILYPDSSITHLLTKDEVSALPALEVQCKNFFGVVIGTGRSIAANINLSNK